MNEFQFYPKDQRQEQNEVDLDEFLGFDDNNEKYVLVANASTIKFTKVNDAWFHPYVNEIETPCIPVRLDHVEEIQFKSDVRVLSIVEITNGIPCLVTEQPNGQISFFSLAVHIDGNLKLQELNDRIV